MLGGGAPPPKGEVKPTGSKAFGAAFVTALVCEFGAVKYLINICGETTCSGAATGGWTGVVSALNSSGGALVTAGIGTGSLEGIGGDGKVIGATGGAGAMSWSLMGGGKGRKRSGRGPA